MKRHDYTPVRLSSRAHLPVDDKLIERQKQAAAKLGPNSIKPILILENPDEFVVPPFVSELPIG